MWIGRMIVSRGSISRAKIAEDDECLCHTSTSGRSWYETNLTIKSADFPFLAVAVPLDPAFHWSLTI